MNVINFEDDVVKQDNVDLSLINSRCQDLLILRDHLKQQEDKVRDIKSQISKLENETLPSLMQQVGLSSVELSTGQKLSIKEDFSCNLPAKGTIEKEKDWEKRENMQERFDRGTQWLIDNQGDGLVKKQIIIDIGTNEIPETLCVGLESCTQQGIEYVMDKTVNANSLKSFLKEKKKNNVDIPDDIFKVHILDKAVLK